MTLITCGDRYPLVTFFVRNDGTEGVSIYYDAKPVISALRIFRLVTFPRNSCN